MQVKNPSNISTLLSAKQLAAKHPAYTEIAIRNLVFFSKPRKMVRRLFPLMVFQESFIE